MDNVHTQALRVNDLLPVLAIKLIHFVKDFPEPDITVPQAFLMNHLNRRGPSRASTIGEMLGITSGPVTSLTKRLIAKGLIERQQDEHDARVVWFSLTEKGTRLADLLDNHSAKRWALLLESLGKDRAEETITLLEDVIRALNQFHQESP